MKLAISTEGENLNAKVDQRFGRSLKFLIINIDGKEVGTFQAVTNEGNIQGHGAGIKAAQQLGELKIDALITGKLGPNATNVLSKLNIKSYSASGIIKDVLVDFVENKLEPITFVEQAHSGISETKKTSTQRIFFPLLNDDGVYSKISEHFGHAPFFGVYDVDKDKLEIVPNNLDHTNPSKSPIDQIQEVVNPTIIFAKGIGNKAIQIINEKGLELKTGDYELVCEVIDNLDSLKNQTESCGHEHH